MLAGALLDRAAHSVIDLADVRHAGMLPLERMPAFLDMPVDRQPCRCQIFTEQISFCPGGGSFTVR